MFWDVVLEDFMQEVNIELGHEESSQPGPVKIGR